MLLPILTMIVSIVTTPTQPQLNSTKHKKVGVNTKMTLHHHHPAHKLTVSNISAVLTSQCPSQGPYFDQNLKGRFLASTTAIKPSSNNNNISSITDPILTKL